MAEDERFRRGAAMIEKVYAGDVTVPPEGSMAFSDLMLKSLFAEVWTREVLSIRDRRLILLGVIGALGEKDAFGIQARASLKNGELTAEQLREVLIMLDREPSAAYSPAASRNSTIARLTSAGFSAGTRCPASRM